MRFGLAVLLLVSGFGVLACGGGGHEAEEPVGTAASSGTSKAPVDIVDATVVVEACPDAHRMNAKLADQAIHELVAPCANVPGGQAHFLATLVPGGRIELAAPNGDPAAGVVPTCVLQHQLVHHVTLKSPCKFDVNLDQGKLIRSASQ